jgi:BTB/POZ domain-containing protein KCTD1/15
VTISFFSSPCSNRYPESRLAKLFNGSIAIVLDSLKQHYFLDRDGRMFRHVLNFVRHGRLMVPKDFQEWALLYEEALWFTIPGMAQDIEEYLERKPLDGLEDDMNSTRPLKRSRTANGNSSIAAVATSTLQVDPSTTMTYECITVNVTPDLGERITLTADRNVAEEMFPEIADGLNTNGRSHAGWNTDQNQLTRFPLNGYCKLNSTQVMQRLLNSGFTIAASSGGGMESQHFTEYLFIRKSNL